MAVPGIHHRSGAVKTSQKPWLRVEMVPTTFSASTLSLLASYQASDQPRMAPNGTRWNPTVDWTTSARASTASSSPATPPRSVSMLIQAPCGSRCACSMVRRADRGAGLAVVQAAGVEPASASEIRAATAPRLARMRPPRRVATPPEHLLHPVLDLAERRRQEPQREARLEEEQRRTRPALLAQPLVAHPLEVVAAAGEE